MSRVTCHVSHVTCHIFFYFIFYFFFTIPPQKNIGPMIRIGREIQCLPYAGFSFLFSRAVTVRSAWLLPATQKLRKLIYDMAHIILSLSFCQRIYVVNALYLGKQEDKFTLLTFSLKTMKRLLNKLALIP